jgi:hypothetical protein
MATKLRRGWRRGRYRLHKQVVEPVIGQIADFAARRTARVFKRAAPDEGRGLGKRAPKLRAAASKVSVPAFSVGFLPALKFVETFAVGGTEPEVYPPSFVPAAAEAHSEAKLAFACRAAFDLHFQHPV